MIFLGSVLSRPWDSLSDFVSDLHSDLWPRMLFLHPVVMRYSFC